MSDSAAVYNRKNPFPASLSVNRCLTAEGSNKDTRHYEIDISGSGLVYEVGDSLSVMPANDPALVDEILSLIGATGQEAVPGREKGETKALRDALLHDYQITQVDKKLLAHIAAKDLSTRFLTDLLDPNVKSDLEQYLWGREVIDFLIEFPGVRYEPAEFVGLLRKLQIRLYSIASSQRMFPDSVHLTVATVRYHSHDRPRKGVCSTFLAERASEPGGVPVFVHSAKHFRLPEDPATPVIMVGPGTGIAPFRAFLQDRKVTGATGGNWLFFGEQYRKSDFFYEDEFAELTREGVLTRLDTAFSRDQDHKIYVQHRMLEAGDELWKWLEDGAYFYVCGDANRMAADVDKALHQVIEQAGGRTPEQAAEYVAALKSQKRYRRDVY